MLHLIKNILSLLHLKDSSPGKWGTNVDADAIFSGSMHTDGCRVGMKSEKDLTQIKHFVVEADLRPVASIAAGLMRTNTLACNFLFALGPLAILLLLRLIDIQLVILG